jgi:hypothetical protein
MLLWPVLLLVDAVMLRLLPGLEVDDWLAAMGAAVALLLGTWPIGLLANYIGLNSTWIFLSVATAVYAVILTVAAALSSGLRSHSAVAVPFAAALIAGLNYYVAPAFTGRVLALSHAHWPHWF